MSTAWIDARWCAFDLETTGISKTEDRIVSWCVAQAGGGEGLVTLKGLVNPGVPIPAAATEIHHITDDLVVDAEHAVTAVDRIAGLLADAQRKGLPIVGFNVEYDLTLLSNELLRYGLPGLEQRIGQPLGPVIDGFVLDKQVDRFRRGSRKLQAVAKHYGIPLNDIDAHGAEADAIAAARVVRAIVLQHPELQRLTLDELHTAQIGWCAEQRDSLRDYFDRKGEAHDGVDPRWPIQLSALQQAAS